MVYVPGQSHWLFLLLLFYSFVLSLAGFNDRVQISDSQYTWEIHAHLRTHLLSPKLDLAAYFLVCTSKVQTNTFLAITLHCVD